MMTEAGETDSFSAFDHVQTLHEHLGRYPDVVLINSRPVDSARLAAYSTEGAEPVVFDAERFREAGVRFVLLELLAPGSQVRHDPDALARWLVDHARYSTMVTPKASSRARSGGSGGMPDEGAA
jgi:2-phospho-L-lactate transferase/gluconeogenesis factor (CofD/UPF0052 family)